MSHQPQVELGVANGLGISTADKNCAGGDKESILSQPGGRSLSARRAAVAKLPRHE
jgi:hypothetical protein